MVDPLSPGVGSMSVDEVRRFLDEAAPDSFVLLDVRQPAEYEAAHLPGARLAPLPDLAEDRVRLDPDVPVVAYCHVGGRSLAAAHLLAGRGVRTVRSMDGGLDAWFGELAFGPVEAGLEIVPADAGPRECLVVALGLERALRDLYADLAERVEPADARALLRELAVLEGGHVRKVEGRLGETETASGETVEGGFRADELRAQAVRFATSLPALVGLAMMVECQAMDLYHRLADRADDPEAGAVWRGLAADERDHLRRLGGLLDRPR